MKRSEKKAIKAIQAMDHSAQVKAIQAMGIEGINYEVALDSLLDGTRISGTEGCSNAYSNYSSQVTEGYKKYNGEAEYGNDQYRAVVDARVAFISGEGVSVTLPKTASKEHKDLFKKFVLANRLQGNYLFDMTKQTEIAGYVIPYLVKGLREGPFAGVPIMCLIGTDRGRDFYKPVLLNNDNKYMIKGLSVTKAKQANSEEVKIKNCVYIRTGGDGSTSYNPTTKVGIVLTECENYDRAKADIRELNYRMARITPNFTTKSGAETTALTKWLSNNNWKIGDARIGTADFKYETVGTGANSNLKDEMSLNLKTISGTTGVPPHWIGWVDMMSNRATAEELYASVYNATLVERTALQDGIKELMIMMQTMAIEAGLITELLFDFEVKLPMIDFGRFKAVIDTYMALHAGGYVCKGTVQAAVPSIDPMLENDRVDEERKEEERRSRSSKTDNSALFTDDDDEDDEAEDADTEDDDE